jgi:putative nucleotidyltransferase with HDIG domain
MQADAPVGEGREMPSRQFQKIKREIEEIGALPTLPDIPAKILQYIASDTSSMDDISRIIERDPPLAAAVLKVANSAYYGMPQRVASLPLALTILGLNEIISIITSISVVRVFAVGKRACVFDRAKFWQHSFGCATAARMLARDLRVRSGGSEFAAGLLHDIGKLILDQFFHAKLREIIRLREEESLTPIEAELRVMGIDHATLGSWLAEQWNLPAILVEAIAYHHRPLDVLALPAPSREPVLTALVHLADAITHEPALGFTESMEPIRPFADNVAWKIVLAERSDLDTRILEQFVDKYEDYRERVLALVEAVA